MITRFPELDAVLLDLTGTVRGILGDTFVGCCLEGSFALGAGDEESDADFLVVTTVPPAGNAEAALRRLHDEIPARPGTWNRNIEGSYAGLASLRDNAGIGTPWLYADRGHRELVWDDHCNKLHTRWILRNHGIALAGPPPVELVAEVPEQALRDAARAALPGRWPRSGRGRTWTTAGRSGTSCRPAAGCSTRSSPAGSRRSPRRCAGPRRSSIPGGGRCAQVAAVRGSPWRPVEPPRPGSMELACAFAAYVAAWQPPESG